MTDPAAPSTGDLRDWLIGQIAETCELDPEELDIRKPLDEYGLSSRDAVELSGALEDWLDVTLPSTLIWDHPTIESLARALTTAEEPTSEPTSEASHAGSSTEPIAVVGVGCRFPGGAHSPERFWNLLADGTEAITEVPDGRWSEYPSAAEGTSRWGGFLDDIAGFDAEFFGIAPREAARMDPQQRMVLEVAWEALEHAGIAAESLRGSDTGVFIGISGTEYGARALADASTVDPWVGTGSALSIAANRLSYVLDLRGPSMSVDTACSSSLTSVHLAASSLRTGESSVALVGGANLLLGPAITASFDQMGLTSADGRCKPFSADADGISRAEGAGIVVLKRLSDAQADGDRVLAVVRGTATNSDGRSNGLTAPNPEAQQALLRQACRNADVSPDTVDYVEAHGTGTLLGDPIEARALGTVFGHGPSSQHPLLIGSVKSNLGHLEAAAGIAGLIKVVLSLHHNELPATLNYSAPNPHISFADLGVSVVDSTRAWPDTGRAPMAGVSGFGFGGTNAHILLEQAEPAPSPARETQYRRYQLGGAGESRIADFARELASWLDNEGASANPADLEYTLARRCSGPRRGAVVATNTATLAAGLRELAEDHPAPAVVPPLTTWDGSITDAPVFVFSGHGSQWAGMGKQLLRDEPVFASAIERLDPLIREHAGFSLLDDLQAGFDASTMDRVQPLVFGIQVALAQLWRAYGVEPAAVIGHSFGEVSAAVVANAITESDGAKIVALRSQLLASLAGDGAMALLEVDADEAARLVEGFPDVDIAAVSSPTQTVVAGSASQVGTIVAEVDSRGLLAKLINLDVAAHSPVVDAVTGTLADGLTDLRPHTPEISFYSTTLPELSEQPHVDAHYWAQNLRRPVRFASAVATALRQGHRTFIELSPRPVLRHALEDNFSWHTNSSPLVLDTLRKCANETEHFHTQLAAFELASTHAPEPADGQLIDIPTTPWRHEHHWQPSAPIKSTDTGEHPLLGTHVEVPDETRHLWRADLGSSAQAWLGDHRISGHVVLNGSAYAEMANAAARHVFDVPAERLVVRELVFHQPLPLADSTSVTTVLTPGEYDDATVTVHTRPNDGSWTLHARATVGIADTSAETPHGNFPELESSTFGDVADSGVYPRLRAIGIYYGPAFHGMSALRTGHHGDDLCAVATIELPDAAPTDSRLRLHPAIVDSCMQVFTAALLEQDPASDAVHLPSSLGTVVVRGDLTRAAYAQVGLRATEEQTAQRGQLRLYDDAGRVLLEAEDIIVRKLSTEEFTAPPSEELLSTRWQPADPEQLDQRDGTDWPGPDGLQALGADGASRLASTQLRSQIATVLGFAEHQLDLNAPLPALGLDSLLAVRIRNAVAHDFELSLPVALLLRGANVLEVEHWLLAELGLGPNDASQPAPAPAGRTVIPPRDAAERLVTTAWREILGIDAGVTDDFYQLGGNQEFAEQITVWLAERSDRELTVSELFEYPSIERMAAHLREDNHESDGSPVRTLRSGNDNVPVFFFHPAGGATTVYKQLADLLDPELPVYGLDRVEGVSSVEDRVREYLPELRSRQPHGPYRLAGWSFGGVLAFEMAQQLRQAGEHVEVVALLDSILPLPNHTGLSEVELLERRFQRFEEFLESSYGRKVDLPYERMAQLDDEDQVQLLIDTMLAEGLVNSAVSDAILHHQRTSFLDARSLERYRPEPYDGRVVFFSAADLASGGLRDERFDRSDPARGWDSVCTDLELVTVSGHHLSMLDPPNVNQIGKHLDKILAATPRLLGTRNG